MTWLGKFIGVILGYKIGGAWGALAGFMLGLLFDNWWQFRQFTMGSVGRGHKNMQEVFFATVFQVMGHIAKSDGRVTEEELQAARYIMEGMRLNKAQRLNAMQQFTLGKSSQFNIEQTLTYFLRVCYHNPFLLRVFVDLQLKAAQQSGEVSPLKQQVLIYIFKRCGYRPFSFKTYSGPGQQSYQSTYNETPDLSRAYSLLGVAVTATPAEIKRAYRRLMSKHHPDKLMAQGASEAMVKMATEKAQEIQLAYEAIRRHLKF